MVSIISGIMLSLVIGLLLQAREKSRKEVCADRLRTIFRGVAKYEEAHQRFPPGRLIPDLAINGMQRIGYTNYSSYQQTTDVKVGFYSVHVWILPFVGAQKIYNLIDFSRGQAKQLTGSGKPFNINYAAYTKPMPLYLCPADLNTTERDGLVGIAENNYRYNFGGESIGAGSRTSGPTYSQRPFDLYHPGGNGAFTIGEVGLETSEFTDGLSKTIFFSERTKGDASDPTAELATNTAIHPFGSGVHVTLTPSDVALQICADTESTLGLFTLTSAGRWPLNSDFANGWPFAGYDSTEYNHVAPPNWEKIDCGINFVPDTPAEGAIIAARSEHEGGVNAAFGDGHVKFMRDEISLTAWRAFGTRNGEEILQQQFPQQQQSQQQGGQIQNQHPMR
jgi:prepilin-type processing-associated H-X9-DG protein